MPGAGRVMKWSVFEMFSSPPAIPSMLETLLMLLLFIFRLLEQTTLPPVDDASVRFPEVVTVTLQPASVLMLEMLNPDIFKNPMFDSTMLPPVVDERTRLLFP
jgi:hypothetical protein